MPKKILLVEDEQHISRGLTFNLMKEGHRIILAEDGAQAIEKWKIEKPDLIVLDIMLPKIDGYSVLSHIRHIDAKIPILILSAKDHIEDKLKGYHLGVDDYLAKPFELAEFLQKVKILLKKAEWYNQEGVQEILEVQQYTFGVNHINFNNFTVNTAKGDLHITDQEAKLLKTFVTQPGKLLTRDELLEESWGYSPFSKTRTVDNFIVRLRKYFEEDPKKPNHFISIRGKGYVFQP